MPDSALDFTPQGTRGMSCVLTTARGLTLLVSGTLDDVDPAFQGEAALTGNRVLTTNVWAFGCAEKERRISRSDERRESLAKQADLHAELACNIADLVERRGDQRRTGWCSSCFEQTEHTKVEAGLKVPIYLCDSCGAATLTCAALHCANMATRGFGAVRLPRFCAEHRHDIPAFARGRERIGELSDAEAFLQFEKANLAQVGRMGVAALAAAGAMTGIGLAAAPLVGGALGSLVGGYSGAAATSYGLALLGGGAVASGGLGMAGGALVVGAAGGALGGGLGASIASAYSREDKSFRIEKLTDGTGVPVVVCSGFLTENGQGWGDWQRIITERYPDSPVYRVHWGAQELKGLGIALGGGGGKFMVHHLIKGAAKHAAKDAAKVLGPLGGAMIVADAAKNPWLRARRRANKTGATLADLLARTEGGEYVLVGHSLGARAMICAAQALATSRGVSRIREMHLLGAAIGADGDWARLDEAVSGMVFNYHSRADKVLKFLYPAAQGGQGAAGLNGMKTSRPGIENTDVTQEVKAHSDYAKVLRLRGPAPVGDVIPAPRQPHAARATAGNN